MKDIYKKNIAGRLGVKDWQVENCERLFAEGATIPFISRYRKERTGGLDDVAVAEIRHWTDVFAEMEKRKARPSGDSHGLAYFHLRRLIPCRRKEIMV